MVLDRAPGMRIPLFVAEHLPGTIEGRGIAFDALAKE
jgi:hypothetical protein